MSDLLERYLQAVGQYLPARRRADTLAELRANLLDEMDDLAEEPGQPLPDAELSAVLQRHGRPILVAARYLPQQSLIGPEIFPFYWLVLKRAFPFVLLIYAVSQAMSVILRHSGGAGVLDALLRFPGVALMFWAFVTLFFAAFEYGYARYRQKLSLPGPWNPSDLPPLSPRERPSLLVSRVADLSISVLLVAWLLTVPHQPDLLMGPVIGHLQGLPIGISPEWHIFYWQVMTLLILQLPLKIVVLFRATPNWRKAQSLTSQILGILALGVLVQARTYFVPLLTQGGSEYAGSIGSLNNMFNLSFRIGLAVAILKLLWDIGHMLLNLRQDGKITCQG
ncbi:MAG TPA: hypothetical protein VFE22_07645 [Edaphobacter sp.]|nr:hypothetical protein [Edaphobacter sp.]